MSEMASAWRHRPAGAGGRRRIDRAAEPAPEQPPRLRIRRGGGWAFLLAMLGSALIWTLLIVAILAVVHHH